MRDESAKSENQRRVFLINPKMQLAFLAYSIGIAFVVSTVFYAATAYFFWKFRRMGQSLGLPSDHSLFQLLGDQQNAMNWIFIVVCAVSTVVLCVGGLWLSLRLAGPLYRLRRHMQDVAEGKTTDDVKFRQKDYFPELAEAFNRVMARVRGR